jgi:membrane protease YdiL (CAAX protease family)
MCLAEQRRTWLNVGVIVGCPTIVACLGVAALMGFGSWAPKWPDWGWLWVANNLALVTLAEEAFFRGYIQGGLERQLAAFRQGQWIALCVAALIFGLAHLAGGWKLVVLAGLAGLGYGLAYRRWAAGGGLDPFRPQPDTSRCVYLSHAGSLKHDRRVSSEGACKLIARK